MSYIKPIYWGPSFWKTMFSFSATYPENPTKEQIISSNTFFNSLSELIPCSKCSISYKVFLTEDDTYIKDINNFSSKKNLIKFVFNLRNKVNQKINIDYGITLDYFTKKLYYMTCFLEESNDQFINNLQEAPIIINEIKNIVYDYLILNGFSLETTILLDKIYNKFLINPIFNYKNNYFKIFYKRNEICRKIINQIYCNMYTNNYDFKLSFEKDNYLHNKLFCLNCTVIPYDLLKKFLQ